MKKRILAMIMTLAMCLSLLPTAAFAAGDTLLYQVGDTFTATSENAELPTTIPEGTTWMYEGAEYENCTAHTHRTTCYSYVLDCSKWHWHDYDCYKRTLTCGKTEHRHGNSCLLTHTWILVEQENRDQYRNWWPVYWDFDKNSDVKTDNVVQVTVGDQGVLYSNGKVESKNSLSANTANTGQVLTSGFQITVDPGYYVTQYRLVCGNHAGCGVKVYSDSTVTANTSGNYTSTLTYMPTSNDFDHWFNIGGMHNDEDKNGGVYQPLAKPDATADNIYHKHGNNIIYPFYLLIEVKQDTSKYDIDYTWGELSGELDAAVPGLNEEGESLYHDLPRNTEHLVQAPSEEAIASAAELGYEFTGWKVVSTSYDNNIVVNANNVVTIKGSNIQLVAQWEKVVTYTVAYDSNGGTGEMTDIYSPYVSGSTVTVMDNDFTKTGYTFAGWNTAADGSGTDYEAGSTFPITADTTLYAKWTANEATITFEENGGSSVSDMNGTTGAKISDTNMPETTRAGYTFEGWYDNEKLEGSKVTVLPSAYPAGTTTYYAKWTANSNTPYAIEYYLENLDGTSYSLKGDATEPRTGTTGATAEIGGTSDIKTFAGFTYIATHPQNVLSGLIVGDGSLVLKLYYDRVDYQLDYQLYGGVITTDEYTVGSVAYGSDIDEPEKAEMKKANHEFVGWYLDGEYKQPWDIQNTMPAQNLTLHAKWKKVIFNISGIDKEVVDVATDVNKNAEKLDIQNYDELTKTLTFPNGGTVEVPRDGSAITLLYKLTVTGEAGAKYVVTDQGATWVGGDEMTGTIGAGGSAVIYVTKSFTLSDITAGNLENEASVAPQDTSSTGTAQDEEKVPAEIEDPNVSVNKTVTKIDGVDVGETLPLANVGEAIEWTITIKNIDETKTLTNLTVTDTLSNGKDVTVTLPDGVTKNADGTYTIASLAPGAEVVITASYTVADTDAGTTLVNSVTVKESENDPGTKGESEGVDTVKFTKDVVLKGDENAPSVNGVTYLEKADSKITLKPGQSATLMYAITVTGTEGKTYTVTDAGTKLVGSTVATNVTDNGNGTYTVAISNNDDPDTSGTVILYVTKTFQRNDIVDNKLTNKATLADETGKTTDAEESTPGEKGSSNNGTTDIPDNPPALNNTDHFAYIIGYPDGNVKPAGNITRAEVATIFFRLLTDEARDMFWSTENEYSDVAANQWFNNAISTLSNAGIINGYEDGSFRPNNPITRAEFAKIAASFFTYAEKEYQGLFSDVPAEKWYALFVEAASDLGLVTGYEDGTFRPEQFITRAESCTIVNRTIDRHPHEDQLHEDMVVWPDNPAPGEAGHMWYYEQVQEATNSHDYEMVDEYENWTEILENRDWGALEKEWSDSNSAPGGEVMQ